MIVCLVVELEAFTHEGRSKVNQLYCEMDSGIIQTGQLNERSVVSETSSSEDEGSENNFLPKSTYQFHAPELWLQARSKAAGSGQQSQTHREKQADGGVQTAVMGADVSVESQEQLECNSASVQKR